MNDIDQQPLKLVKDGNSPRVIMHKITYKIKRKRNCREKVREDMILLLLQSVKNLLLNTILNKV